MACVAEVGAVVRQVVWCLKNPSQDMPVRATGQQVQPPRHEFQVIDVLIAQFRGTLLPRETQLTADGCYSQKP
jgi:hypothetical protein